MTSSAFASSHKPTSSSSSTSSQGNRMNKSTSAVTLPTSYHYERKSAVKPAQLTESQVLESRRHFTQKDTMQAMTKIGKTHKSNFSVTSLLGAHQGSGGTSGFGSKSRHRDPWSMSSSDGLRAQFSGSSQEPCPISLTGSNDGGAVQRKLEALEPLDLTGELRNPASSISLRLKMPKFKSIGRPKSSNGGQPHSPASASRAQPPFTLHSTTPSFRPRLSNDTFALGTMPFENNSPCNHYLIPHQTPNLEESRKTTAPDPTPRSTTSSVSTDEERVVLTPTTIRSGLFRHKSSPGLPELSPSRRDEDNLKYTTFLCDNVPSSVIRSAEFSKTRTRPFPTITQDDMSLDLQGLAEKRKSLNRFSRRASISATSMLSSSSSTPSKQSSSSSRFDGDDIDHRSSLHSTPNALTVADPGYIEIPTSPLSPITFEPIPSPHTDSTLVPSPTLTLTHTPIPSDGLNDDDSAPTPIALVHPDMPFNSIVETSHLARNTAASYSNPQSRTASRTNSSEIGSRGSTPDMFSRRSGGARNTIKATPAQIAKWEEDERMVTRDIMEQYAGEAYIIRYEAKQSWMGVWNRQNISDVIDGLRDLRSPKF